MAAVLLVGLVAIGCRTEASELDASSDAESLEPSVREFDRSIPWQSALLEDPGRSVTIAFTGGRDGNLEDNPCVGEYDVEVEETTEAVTITLYSLRLAEPPELPDGFGCTDEGYARRIGVTIGNEGLAGRELIDGSNGQIRIPIDETALLMPSYLPDGWSEWDRQPQNSAMVFFYGPADGSGFPPLMYLVAPTADDGFFNMDRENIASDLTTVEEISVRGTPGGAFLVTSLEDGARTIVFDEDGRHHQIVIQSGIPDEVGFDFIESLG